MTEERKAEIILNTAQKQRLHWSTMITTIMGFTIVVVAGIWSYLLPQFIQAEGNKPAYFLIGAAVTSLIFGLWRIYTSYLDNTIAGLYAEIVYAEIVLNFKKDMGVRGYLISKVPHISKVFSSEQEPDPEKEMKIVKELVESRCIGSRGHSRINNWSLAIITLLFIGGVAIVIYNWDNLLELESSKMIMFLTFYHILLVLIIVGLILACLARNKSQKDPSEQDVLDAIQKVK